MASPSYILLIGNRTAPANGDGNRTMGGTRDVDIADKRRPHAFVKFMQALYNGFIKYPVDWWCPLHRLRRISASLNLVVGMLSRTEIRVPLVFVFFASLWILLSDSVVTTLFADFGMQQMLQTYKGLLFVAVITVLLHFLIRRDVRRDQERLLEIQRLHNIQQSIFTSMKRVFIAVDSDWTITICNPAALLLLGRDTESEVIGRKIWGLLPVPMLQALRESVERHSAQVNSTDIEFQDRTWWTVQFVQFSGGMGIFLEDITDSKMAAIREAELIRQREESLKRLELHIERLPIGYIITDVDFRFQYLNPAAEEIFGYRMEELKGREPYGTIMPEDARELVDNVREQWLQGVEPAHATSVNISRDRGEIYCDWYNTPMLDENGEFQYLISMVQDVTDRFHADEALRRSELRYRAVVEDQTEYIVRWKPDGTRSFVNHSFCRFCAQDAESMLRINQFAWLSEKDAAELRVVLPELSVDSPSLIALHPAVGANGAERKLRWSHRALFNEDGIIMEIQSVARDITEQVHAEQQVRLSEERYRALIEYASEGILTIENGTFTSCNRRAADMLGYNINEIVGRTPEELSPRVQPNGMRSVELVEINTGRALDGEPLVFEWEHIKADGGSVTIEVSLGRVMDDERPKLLCFWRDITERMVADKRLRESREQLRALTARLDAVREEERKQLSRELHDGLGQTLTALKIDISLMKRFLAASSAPVEHVETIESMNAMVDVTLQLTRELAGSLRPALLEEVGLERALDRLLTDVCGKTGLTPEFVSNGAPELDEQHALTLYRIAQEALTNIVRHAKASKVTLALVADGANTSMFIDDDGIGIAPNIRWREGALGIVGMRERAEQSGGSLLVEPLKDKGTRVAVRVPATALRNVTAEGMGT